ncbi:hypothetical protein GOV14_06475 [Candidatus Pacearchaeota archaeon]|nr:hypothetical protein [Candidatus Pacearchaeota archaeon]
MGSKLVYFAVPLIGNFVFKTDLVMVPPYEETIYDALGFFEDEIFAKSKFKCTKAKVKDEIQIKKIINLHDENGLKIKKIKRLVRLIESGRHVFAKSGIPNIKLVKTNKNEWLIFDGHHTLVAYSLLNKKYLNEVPHLVIESRKDPFTDKQINVFFGKHSKKLENRNWRKYVINWNASFENQLAKRRRRNMGELINSIKIRIDL